MKTAYEAVVIREVLEGMIAPDVAAAVLFAALDKAGDEPVGHAEWSRFAAGPLREALHLRLGEDVAEEVASQVRAILGTPPPPRPRRSDFPTAPFPTGFGPTRVLVLARSGQLARRLKAALGPAVVPMVLGDIERIHTFSLEFQPNLVVVDLTDAPERLGELPTFAQRIQGEVLFLVFDEGTPLGKGTAKALEDAGRRTAIVDRREDVGPLVDLVRASQQR
ncbi:MAG: hypothetical protein H6724_08990 [Sandaracinus sp.]|nr:hypothetical protein [Sandaracinus sp.]